MNYKEQEISWADFKIKAIDGTLPLSRESHSAPLFRGQGLSSWQIDSTLYREFGDMQVSQYLQHAQCALIKISSLSYKQEINYRWDDWEEFDELSGRPKVACCEKLIFLRHSGFPSPFLDWTRSPFIAAFFAFNNPHVEYERGKHATIYCLRRIPMGCGNVHGPRINILGPNLLTHRRHYLQQAEYTFCLETTKSENAELTARQFISHETAIGDLNPEDNLGEVIKFNISHTERQQILKDLWKMNINDHSLFGDAESLCRSVSYELFKKPYDTDLEKDFWDRKRKLTSEKA